MCGWGGCLSPWLLLSWRLNSHLPACWGWGCSADWRGSKAGWVGEGADGAAEDCKEGLEKGGLQSGLWSAMLREAWDSQSKAGAPSQLWGHLHRGVLLAAGTCKSLGVEEAWVSASLTTYLAITFGGSSQHKDSRLRLLSLLCQLQRFTKPPIVKEGCGGCCNPKLSEERPLGDPSPSRRRKEELRRGEDGHRSLGGSCKEHVSCNTNEGPHIHTHPR